MAIVSPIKTITSNNKIVAIGEFTANDKISITNLEYNFIKINGTEVKLGNTFNITVDAMEATASIPGVVKLNDSINSSNTDLAATANSVRTVYDLANLTYSSASNAEFLTSGTLSNSRLANIPNSVLANDSIIISTGEGLSGGSSVALGSKITLIANSASITEKGIVQLNDSIDSDSISLAATANSVKTTYDLANSKLDSSGGNITGGLSIGGILSLSDAKFLYSTKTVNSGSVFSLDEISGANTVNYLIEMKQGMNFHSAHLLVLNDVVKEYCNVSTVSIGSFESVVIGDKITLNLINYNDAEANNIIVKFLRTSI